MDIRIVEDNHVVSDEGAWHGGGGVRDLGAKMGLKVGPGVDSSVSSYITPSVDLCYRLGPDEVDKA